MKKMKITKGKFVILDDADYNNLSNFKWCFHPDKNGGGYAARRLGGKISLMHREIMNTPNGMETDHINGDKLDNRRKNLRICDKSLNNANRQRYSKKRKGIYKGVFWHSQRKKWRAAITFCKKQIHLGLFDDEKMAAIEYNKKAIQLFGEYALINKI